MARSRRDRPVAAQVGAMHWRAAQRARLRGGRALTTGWDYQVRLGSLRVDRGATRFRLFSSRIWGARRELQRQRFADLCSLRALGTSPRLGQCGHVPAGARRWFTCGCGTIFEPNRRYRRLQRRRNRQLAVTQLLARRDCGCLLIAHARGGARGTTLGHGTSPGESL